MPPSPRALVLAVVSGKGGVGKSTVAVNLTETLAAAGRSVALVDVDLGQGACATLLNEHPGATAVALAAGAVSLDRVLHATASGATLVMGGSTATPDDAVFDALDAALDAVAESHDVVVLDAPAGVGGAVRWALDRADFGVLVLVGEPTAVTGAYTLAKTVWQADPDYPFFAVVNAADTDADATQTLDRFGELTTRFLGQAPTPLGWLPYDAHVRAAVREQCPAVRRSAPLRASFGALASALSLLAPAPRTAA